MNLRQTAKRSLATIVLCLLLAGCIPVKNVEKAWSAGKADKALAGTWVSKSDASEKIGFVLTDKGFLVTSDNNACRTVQVNGHQFLIFAKMRAAVLGFDQVEDEDKDGTLFRYTVVGDTLTMYILDQDKLKAAVKAKEVAGELDENNSPRLLELDDATLKWLGSVAGGPGWDKQVYTKKK